MKMNDDQKMKMKDFLNSRWESPFKCSYCGKNEWIISDSLFQLIEFNDGNLVIGGDIVPIIPVSCSNCGNTVLVSAVVAGIVKS